MTVCGHKRIQHPKKPLYSAVGPSFLSSKPKAWKAFLYSFFESFIKRTLITSIGADVALHTNPAIPEQTKCVRKPSGKVSDKCVRRYVFDPSYDPSWEEVKIPALRSIFSFVHGCHTRTLPENCRHYSSPEASHALMPPNTKEMIS